MNSDPEKGRQIFAAGATRFAVAFVSVWGKKFAACAIFVLQRTVDFFRKETKRSELTCCLRRVMWSIADEMRNRIRPPGLPGMAAASVRKCAGPCAQGKAVSSTPHLLARDTQKDPKRWTRINSARGTGPHKHEARAKLTEAGPGKAHVVNSPASQPPGAKTVEQKVFWRYMAATHQWTKSGPIRREPSGQVHNREVGWLRAPPLRRSAKQKRLLARSGRLPKRTQ